MSFITEDFMLKNKTAKMLYYDYAKNIPIIDYHCCLNPCDAAENRHFKNLTEFWLNGDRHKWRAMRCCGINEKYITGNADDFEKFKEYAKIVPYLIGNPLYHRTHLELLRYFGITKSLCEETAEYIWDAANEQLADKNFCVHNIFEKFKVEAINTADTLRDTLEWHTAYTKKHRKTKVLPMFCPDTYINIELPAFKETVKSKSYDDIKNYLKEKLAYFIGFGCCTADMNFTVIPYSDMPESVAEAAFERAVSGENLSKNEIMCYKFHMTKFLGELCAKKDIVLQIHYNTLCNNNGTMFKRLGSDVGFDSINDCSCAENLSKLMNAMNIDGLLPKTIVHSMNANDTCMLADMAVNFHSSESRSRIQIGAGRQIGSGSDGIMAQLKAIGSFGALGCFIGMPMDSVNFSSFPQQEYFRRILCSVIGEWVESGEYQYDKKYLEKMIKGISYENAKNYFGI